MASKKKEDRIKSSTPISPYGRKSKEGTSGAISSDGKQPRVTVWTEFSENDINNEKWDMTSKAKEKEKIKSPQMGQNLFDDPDGKLRLPLSLKVVKWRRASDYFTKTPVVVDNDNGIHDFDIFTPNDHLFTSETMRWIICQINTLWMITAKHTSGDVDNQAHDNNFVSPKGVYHTWKFWDHIYSINKVGKGLPQFNPAGKYIVKLFWMGEWRKIYVDDNLPFDENDRLLLPVTNLNNELWPIILAKGLLKIASLSYGFSSSDTEFGDFSVIHSLTGWIPQMKIITKEHQNQIWKHLGDLLPHFTFPEREKSFVSLEKIENALTIENQENGNEKIETKESNSKDKKDKKDGKDSKAKDKKDKEKEKEKEKSKPVILEGKQTYENPETIVFASYKSGSSKLSLLDVSKMADHGESLRKIGFAQTYSHPILLNYYRDCLLVKPRTPETVPAWKLIRPMVKPELPKSSDCTTHDIDACKKDSEDINDLKMIEIQSPFLNYKISNTVFPAVYSRLSKSPIADIVEDDFENDQITSLNDVLNSSDFKDANEATLDSDVSKKRSNAIKNNSVSQKMHKHTASTDDALNESFDDKDVKRNTNAEDDAKKSWINIDTFCECFQVLHIFHKPETYRYSETIMDNKQTNIDQKEPIYLFVDNTESSEIIFCLSVFCKWLSPVETPVLIESQTNRNSPLISTLKDGAASNEVNYVENDSDNQTSLHPCSFIAENHSWKLFKVGNIFKRARTNGTKAISLILPPGRHCIRIFIECKNGFHCKVISQNEFHLKGEDSIMPFFTEEPKRIKDFASNIMQSFTKIIENFSNVDDRTICEKSFVNLILPFTKTNKLISLSSKVSQIFGQSFVNAINLLNKEIITQDMIFAIRALTLFFESNNIILNVQQKALSSNRNSAKGLPIASTKVDSRKQSSSKSTVNPDNKDDRKIETYSKEYSEEGIVFLQKLFKGLHIRKVLSARDPSTNNHSRVVTELKKLSTIIDQNPLKFGMNILNDITDKYPEIFKYYKFENDKLNHISLQEYSGSTSSPSSGAFEILFREIFHMNKNKSKIDLIIKLSCSAPKCTLMVINNDNNEFYSDSILKRLHLSNLQPNIKGYTIFGFVKEADTIINWKLKLICDGNDSLPQSLKQELCSDFSVTKIRDYYIPNRHGQLCHQLIKVKNDHPATIYVKLSNPLVQFRLSVYNYEEEIYSMDGKGEALIPSFIFSKDDVSDIGSGRSPSRTSTKSKKTKDKQSAKNSRTNSSCSGDENKVNKYSVQVFVDNDTWPLTDVNEEFIQSLRRSRKKEIGDIKSYNENPTKSTPNVDSSKKESSQKSQNKAKGKEKGQDNAKVTKGNEKSGSKPLLGDSSTSRPNSNTFESDKAHWIFYLISDASAEDNIQVSRNNEKYEHLYATKKLWEEIDPLRFEKGKQIQKRFIEEYSIGDTNEESERNLETSLRPLNIEGYYRTNDISDINDLESKRIQSIEEFRQHQLEWTLWCQKEKSERTIKIIKNLNSYNKLQEAVNSHRSDYYRARENFRHLNPASIKTQI